MDALGYPLTSLILSHARNPKLLNSQPRLRARLLKGVYKGSIVGFSYIGALVLRIGFWGIFSVLGGSKLIFICKQTVSDSRRIVKLVPRTSKQIEFRVQEVGISKKTTATW